MKKILFLLLLITIVPLWAFLDNDDHYLNCSPFLLAFTAGYVFKHHDAIFKEVYGRGIPNLITVDGCYFPWETWGLGTKISYWRTKGKTTVLKETTHLQEEPLTFYLRKTVPLNRFQVYASLGGGVIFIQEKSYLGNIKRHKGIGELEVGAHCALWRFLNATAAFRYLFPRESICGQTVDTGGFDLRAGLSFTF